MKLAVRARVDDSRVITVDALPTPLPGLVLADLLDDPDRMDRYELIHVRSGLGVAWASSPETLAQHLPSLADVAWTSAGDDLRSDPDVVALMGRLRAEHYEVFGGGAARGPASDLPKEAAA